MLNVTNIKLDSLDLSEKHHLKEMLYTQDAKTKMWHLIRRKDSVSVIVFNVSRQVLICVRQFRPSNYLSSLPNHVKKINLQKYHPSLGTTIELAATEINEEKSIIENAQDEVRKSCGYEAPLLDFQKIISTRSVGSSVDRQTLVYVEVIDEMKSVRSEEDDNKLVEAIEMTIDEAEEYINTKDVNSPPQFLAAIRWFLINKKKLHLKI